MSATKVIYFVTSHGNPDQVLRLVKTLKNGSPECLVLLHHDYSKSYFDPALLKSMTAVYQMDYLPLEWGDFSYVRMVLTAIDWLAAKHIEFDWLILLSGQDYPIQPLNQIEYYLQHTTYDGFMTYGLATDTSLFGEKAGIDHYFYRYYKLPHFVYYYKIPQKVRDYLRKTKYYINSVQPLLRFKGGSRGVRNRFGIRCIHTPFADDFKCYRGSAWFTLNYKCIKYIQQFVREYPDFIRHYERTFIPDESFFLTILNNSQELTILNDNKRYILFSSRRSAHPDILTVDDFELIVSSQQHFARKFDITVDSEVLSLIDSQILRRASS